MTQLADEILIACADGELSPEQRRLVDGVMLADPLARERFEQQMGLNERLAQAFASMLEAQARQAAVEQMSAGVQQESSREMALPEKQVGSNKKLLVVAAAVVLLAAGGMGGYLAGLGSGASGGRSDPFGSGAFWQAEQTRHEDQRSIALRRKLAAVQKVHMQPNTAPTGAAPTGTVPIITAATNRRKARAQGLWYEAVAARHKRDAALLVDRYDGKSRNPELALFQLANSSVAPARIPVLKDEQLVFVGASLEKIAGADYACLIYRDRKNGSVPIGLYVSDSKGGSLTLERGYRGDDNYVRWTQGAHSYMLIGPVPHWRLIVLSVAVQRKIVQ